MKDKNLVCYDKKIATKYGLLAAVLLSHIGYWEEHNKMKKQGKIEGNYWMFRTTEAFAEEIGVTVEVVKRNLYKLKVAGLILVQPFCTQFGKRINHYRLADTGKEYLPKFKKEGDKLVINYEDTPGQIARPSVPNSTPKGAKQHTQACDIAHPSVRNGTPIYKEEIEEGNKPSVLRTGASGASHPLLDPEPSGEPIGPEVEVMAPEDGNKEINKQVNELLNAMAVLSPAYKHGDFAHRAVAKRMINRFGLEECIQRTFMARQARRMPYAPSTNNIFQLEENWYKLEDFAVREEARLNPRHGIVVKSNAIPR